MFPLRRFLLLPLLPLTVFVVYLLIQAKSAPSAAEMLGSDIATAAAALDEPETTAATPTAAVASVALSSDSLKAVLTTFAGRQVRYGTRSAKRVALTFDDGPHPVYTPRVIQTLKNENVKATFFMLGLMVEQNPEVARLVASSGFEIGNHSHSHKRLTQFDADGMRREMIGTAELIETVTGVKPHLFRPPYGSANRQVYEMGADAETVLCFWSVDPEDWTTKANATKIVEAVMSNVKPGDIILLHDIHARTVEALPTLISRLKEEGYELVTVTELLYETVQAREAATTVAEGDAGDVGDWGDAVGGPAVPAAVSAPSISLDILSQY